jgi:ribose 1,5-bisphosphate isomerase
MDTSNGKVDEVARSIEDMSIRGAGKIAKAASAAIADYASEWKGNDPKLFLEDLRSIATRLHLTRPTAVSLRNGILLTLKDAQNEPDVRSIKDHILRQSEEFVESAVMARQRIAEVGSKRIPKGSTVLTHCNSMAALTTIHKAHEEGRVDMVFSTESRPWR